MYVLFFFMLFYDPLVYLQFSELGSLPPLEATGGITGVISYSSQQVKLHTFVNTFS